MITVDTNIYISAFKFGRKPMELLEMAARGEIEIAVSQEIIDDVGRAARQVRILKGIPMSLRPTYSDEKILASVVS